MTEIISDHRIGKHSYSDVHFFVVEELLKVFPEYCPVCILVRLNVLVELKAHIDYFSFCLRFPELFV